MVQLPSATRAGYQTAGATHELAPWIERVARLGFGARGVVYITVGVLAVKAASGAGGRTTDANGALATILSQPFGKILLSLMACGLFGYAGWRTIAAVTDPERKGRDAKGVAKRIGDAGKAVVHAALAVQAVRLIAGAGSSGSAETRDWTARLLSAPLGVWLVAFLGAGVIAYGLYQLYRAYAVKLSEQLDLSRLSAGAAAWTVRSGRLGMAARGVVFILMGLFLIRASIQSDANQARGLAGALRALQQQDSGPWLLGIVAVGLAAYGVYQLVEARYRRIRSV